MQQSCLKKTFLNEIHTVQVHHASKAECVVSDYYSLFSAYDVYFPFCIVCVINFPNTTAAVTTVCVCVCMHVCVCGRACVRACVCVCVWERGKGKEGEREGGGSCASCINLVQYSSTTHHTKLTTSYCNLSIFFFFYFVCGQHLKKKKNEEPFWLVATLLPYPCLRAMIAISLTRATLEKAKKAL